MSKMTENLAWMAKKIQPKIDEVAKEFEIQKPSGEDKAVAEVIAGILLGNPSFAATDAVRLSNIINVDAHRILLAHSEIQLEKLNYSSPEASKPEKRVEEPRRGCSGGRSSVREDMQHA